MIQKLKVALKVAWRTTATPIEAMSASMALAFLAIFLSGSSFNGFQDGGDPLLNRIVWVILCGLASIPYFVGWVQDHQRLRNFSLLMGVSFWSLITANYALVHDSRGLTWGVYTAFVCWAYWNRRRDNASQRPR